jgi:hypothetical protein
MKSDQTARVQHCTVAATTGMSHPQPLTGPWEGHAAIQQPIEN